MKGENLIFSGIYEGFEFKVSIFVLWDKVNFIIECLDIFNFIICNCYSG